MPDIFSQLQSLKEKEKEQSNIPQENNLNQYGNDLDNTQEQKQQEKSYSIEGDLSTPEQNKINNDNQVLNRDMGVISTENNQPLQVDDTTWSADYSAKSFLNETSDSILRGVGNHIIKGTGDLLQVAFSGFGYSDDLMTNGNFLSRALQESGEEFASKFKSYIPEELQHENLSWKSITDARFWSTHVAEMVPQLAEFIFLSKGGSALARKGVGALAKRAVKKGAIKGAAKTALKKEVAFTGRGLAGKLVTDEGLSVLGNEIVGTVGGGITGNVFSGMLNAAEVINTNKELKDANGNPLYTNEQLAQMGKNTMLNNLNYIGVDIATWGMTYGGGWKALKGLNPLTKGGAINTALQQSKTVGSLFKYQVSPVLQSIAKLAGKAGTEGLEETFQESFEEWAKKKAVSEVTGEPLEYKDFFEFYNSKENEGTKVLAGALGALGGGAFNVRDVINKKAEENYKILDRTKNLSEIINRQGSEAEQEWQEFYKQQTIAEIVIDEKEDLFDDFITGLVDNNNIKEEEVAVYQEMFETFKEVNRKAKNLNVKGRKALMHNAALENYFNNQIEREKSIVQENIQTIKEQGLDPQDEFNAIEEQNAVFQQKLKALAKGSAEAKQNQNNLILGKKASAIDVSISYDSQGNKIITAGLTDAQMKEFTSEDEFFKDGKLKDEKEKGKKVKTKKSFKLPSLSLGKKSKGIYDSILDTFGLNKDSDNNVENNKEENVDDEIKATLNDDEIKSIENEFGVDVERNFKEDKFTVFAKKEFENDPDKEQKIADAYEVIEGILNDRRKQQQSKEDSKKEEESKEKEDSKQAIEEQSKEILEKSSLSDTETFSDESYDKIKDDLTQVSDKVINDIADKIYNKEKISERENNIKEANENRVLDSISRKMLEIDRKNEIKDEVTDSEVTPKKDDEGKVDVEKTIDEDESLSPEEKAFIKSQLSEDENLESMEDVEAKKSAKSQKGWKPKAKNIKDSESRIGYESKSDKTESKENKLKRAIRVFNRESSRLKNRLFNKATKQFFSKKQEISENDLDNYLDSSIAYNLEGPSQLHKMAVVNHHLKRLFPASKTQVIYVKNLFDALGSEGVGYALASTIFIDDKAWQQKKVFMHEMSHIFLDMAWEEPEVKSFISKMLTDKKLVSFIKEKYDDYTLYKDKEGNEYRKDQLSSLISGEYSVDDLIKSLIDNGDLKTVPLKEQRHLIHEMFAAKMEGPLDKNFDSIFNPIHEPKRQKDVKKFWGLIRKKGEILNEDDGIYNMLKSLEDNGEPTLSESYIFETLRNATQGVKISSYGLESRADTKSKKFQKDVEEYAKRKNSKINNEEFKLSSLQEEIERQDFLDQYEQELDETGVSFYNTDFNQRAKKATRILKKFGTAYNKAVRLKALSKGEKPKLFDKESFESLIYELALENDNSNAFGVLIEQSKVKEIQAFNKYLDQIFPETKEQILTSMHFVLSNSKHVVGIRNNFDDAGNHFLESSLSQSEQNKSDNIMRNLEDMFYNDKIAWEDLKISIDNIYNNKGQKEDYLNILDKLSNRGIKTRKILEQGYLTYKGNTIPLETLISGMVKRGMFYNGYDRRNGKPGDPSRGIYFGNFLPLVKSLIDTNRKFTPFSSVENAEGNMEPVRITNNNLTKEIDNIIKDLSSGMTEEEFLEKYSHTAHKNKESLGKRYIPNQLLKFIYDNYQKGILPTISQYHGIKDISNNNGSLYKNSTATEQRTEDLLNFVNTSRNKQGGKLDSYLGSIGTFADSPRKFLMNMKRIDYGDVFSRDKNGKVIFNTNGEVINNLMNLHNQFFNDELNDPNVSLATQKLRFKKALVNAIKDDLQFFKDNINEFSRIKSFKPYLQQNANGEISLNQKGRQLIGEFTINSIVNGYNIGDIFSPGIKGSNIVKRLKGNTSPVVSVKNPNFKIEPIFVSDSINKGSISGSDSGMFITKEAAEKLQRLGKGVFEMNGGFKLLVNHVEKDNPKLKGKTAYLKGYTTVIDETHPFHKILKAREDKWAKLNPNASMDLSDGTANHMAVIIPVSSDKANFFDKKLYEENENGEQEYTDEGLKRTPEYLAENIAEMEKELDGLYYDDKGNFVGVSSENFGPQQLMDKTTDMANVGVQLINSIIVNADINGRRDFANSIQEHINNQKEKELNKIFKELEPRINKKTKQLETKAQAYNRVIQKYLNKEDMDQAQRIIIENDGSLSNPYVNEIVVNQLAKMIRRAGNKLSVPGTYAQQKPDTGFIDENTGKHRALKGYGLNSDGSLSAAEIVLPQNMKGKVFKREYFTVDSVFGKQSMKSANSNLRVEEYFGTVGKAKDQRTEDLNNLKFGALAYAQRVHGLKKINDAEAYIGEVTNEQGVLTGYYVKGETVIASRVPGHGPSTTGVFEVINFDEGQGNQTMVSSEFNDIIGSDNDGDALFINTKGDKEFSEWNKAFDKITEYWLSKDMAEQVTAKIDFEKETEKIVEKVNKKFPKNKEYVFPFSPKQRMIDYNNTMVSKRNVGPVFNIHKITNMLAAYNVGLKSPIVIGSTTYENFKDNKRGNESRNQQSAILANIILDNAKWGFADSLGLDEHNISQAVMLVNLGVSLEDVGYILNSPAAKLWSQYNRNNNSMFHRPIKRSTISQKIKEDLGISKTAEYSLEVDPKNADKDTEQGHILALFEYLSDMNSEVQKISHIMSGHNKIHVNPLVLQKQINEFNEVVYGDKNLTLEINDDFRSNPDMKNYRNVAEATLSEMEYLNPSFRTSTKKVLESISGKINEDLSVKEIESISEDLKLFISSRLLGLNNVSKAYVEDLMNPKSKTSIYSKMNEYIKPLRTAFKNDQDFEKNPLYAKNILEESILFDRALRLSLGGNVRYISANSDFVNESFNESERLAAQEEFNELPKELKDDLIIYDLVKHGWKGPQSLLPFFDKETNEAINIFANLDSNEKNKEINDSVLEQLEKSIVLKKSKEKSNPFLKSYIKDKKMKLSDQEAVKNVLMKNPEVVKSIKKGKPFYINVRRGNESELYQLPAFTKDEISLIKMEKTKSLKNQKLLQVAKSKIEHIPNNNSKIDNNIDIAMIRDTSISSPYKTYDSSNISEKLDPLVEATIAFQEKISKGQFNVAGYDAREDYDIDLFTKKEALTYNQYNAAMEFNKAVSDKNRKLSYDKYLKEKAIANSKALEINEDYISNQTTEKLLDLYVEYGEKDVYANSIIVTPIIKELANRLSKEQSDLTGKEFNNEDVSVIQSHLMTGSTIPSNHPASQGLVRMIEEQYKNFIEEKKKRVSEMNEITNRLYQEKLGYSGGKSIMNTLKRIRDVVFSSKRNVYDKLYGNLVIREEKIDAKGKLTYDFRLKPKEEINRLYDKGLISKAEKDFYDFFKKTTKELMPKNLKSPIKKDYIPHTSMTAFETLSNRGLLGLMLNSRGQDEALGDVKMYFENEDGKKVLMPFSEITDRFKLVSGTDKKNSLSKVREYQKLKSKAKKLLKKGLNEDNSEVTFSPVGTETALGFGAINRFANNRSVKSTELPSMDLNKALGDYIHSTIFVNGHGSFKGMQKLQGFIDGVLAFNRENNMDNMNKHVQTIWKDYFTKGKRQTSFAGDKVDRVIVGLTRLNLFYALGYKANVNTGGMYAIGNILSGKYHNIKDIGGKEWIKGELKYWGLDKGFEGGLKGVIQRHKRMQRILKNLNFMEINVYDEVNLEKKAGLDAIFTDLALMPMIKSEEWIQRVHMIGLLDDEYLNKFDEEGNYKNQYDTVPNDVLIELEDRVKSSHGRGYQPTDQRAVQMYSWGNMMLQFSKFIPTMVHDRFAKEDINIYGKKNIGTLRAVGKMIRNVVNNPDGFKAYRDSLKPEEKQKLDSGLRGLSMATLLSLFNASTGSETGNALFWDTNYYWNHPKLQNKLTPSAIRSTQNLLDSMF